MIPNEPHYAQTIIEVGIVIVAIILCRAYWKEKN